MSARLEAGTLPFFFQSSADTALKRKRGVSPREVLVITILLAVVACSPAPKTEAERTVADRARGVRYVVPEGWKSSDGEVRSRDGSLLTLRVYDLVEAEKGFVAGLPDSVIPQLREWAELYYIVEGPPSRSETRIAGLPAIALVYPIRVRKKDPPSKVIYWVVTRETRLFVLRAAFPPNGLATDEPVMRKIVDGWSFL